MRLAELPEGLRIDWDATPQNVLGGTFSTLRAPKDLGKARCRRAAMIGRGCFYVDARDGRANLTLMRSTKPGYWQTELVEQDVIEETGLPRPRGRPVMPRSKTDTALCPRGCAQGLQTVSDGVKAGEVNDA